MNCKAHSVGGLLFGIGSVALLAKNNIESNALYLVAASAFGSLLPDIDHPKSYLGQKIPIIPDLLYSYIGHRTLTHSLLFAFVVAVVTAPINVWIGIGLFVGIISHIALDLLTPSGVAFLYPFRKKRIKLM